MFAIRSQLPKQREWKLQPLWLAVLLIGVLLVISSCGGAGDTPTPTVSATAPTQPPPTATPLPPSNAKISSIHMFDAHNGWATTADLAILHTASGPTSWQKVTPAYPVHLLQHAGISTAFLSPTTAWIAAVQVQQPDFTFPTTIFRTSDGGQSWQSSTLPKTQLGVTQITFVDAHNGWILANLGGSGAGQQAVDIFHSVDGGKTWEKISSAPGTLTTAGFKSGLSFVNATTGWITGSVAAMDFFLWLYVSHDSGKTWQHQSIPLPKQHGVIATSPPIFFNGSDGILPVNFTDQNGTPSAIFYITHNAGTSWESTATLPTSASSEAFLDMTTGWVIGKDGQTLYRTTDNEQHWGKVTTISSYRAVYGLDFVSTQLGWAIGGTGASYPYTPTLIQTTDGGHTWTPVTFGIA
jgi:photosystem II stability/assembly factor-like uncharacterized protein